jgi:hypothetical protein
VPSPRRRTRFCIATRWASRICRRRSTGPRPPNTVPVRASTSSCSSSARPQQLSVAEFALVDLPSVLFFLYRFGERIGWSDAPYNVHLEPAEQRVEIPALAPEQRLPLTLLLIDAATGIVQVNRALTLSHEFGVTLHDALHAQLAAPFDRTTYHQACTAAYNRFPTTHLLLNQAVARSQAGE